MLVQLIDPFGEICAEKKCAGDKAIEAFKEKCRKLYGKKINDCRFNLIPNTLNPPTENEKPGKPKKEIIPAEKLGIKPDGNKSLFMGKWKGKKNKYGVKGGSTGKKYLQIRPSRYY